MGTRWRRLALLLVLLNWSHSFRIPRKGPLALRATDSGVDDPSNSEETIPDSIRAPRQKSSRGGTKPRRKRLQGRAAELGMNNPSRLKILGGSARGRRLDSPDVYLRPMMGKVREAVFSSLNSMGVFSFKDRPVRHLDLFAGSGSVGLEALSRGADHATFVDMSKDCIATIVKNAAWCDFAERVVAVEGDVLEVLEHPEKFELSQPYEVVSITPPYEEVNYRDLVRVVTNSPLVKEDTLVIIEYPVELGTLPRVMQNGKLPTGLYDVEAKVEEFLDL